MADDFELLLDANGNRIGSVRTFPDGQKMLTGADGKPVGNYYPQSNTTIPTDGRGVMFGNLLASLLPKPPERKW